MWDGPRQGPRGGPPFRGDQRGDMFGNRDGPMPDFRGRDGMNMGPMGPMGLRNQDMHMDMRRMDGPPAMRGRDMEPFDMRGREQNRDFCRPGNDPDFTLRRQFEMAIRDKLMNASGFMGQGRNSSDMGGRGMPNDRFMDMRDREMFRNDMPGFNNNNMDSRRGFPVDPMGRNEGFRDRQDRPPMGMDNMDGFNMDMPPRDRGMMDFDRRGGPPFSARGGFKSDMDFRNCGGPSAEMMGRDRSPMRFGENDGAPMDVRGRSDMPPDLGGPNRSKFTDKEGPHKDRAFPDSRATPPLDFRGGEEMTLAEEWKSRRAQEKNAPAAKGVGDSVEQRFPPGLGRGGKALGAFGFPRISRFSDLNLPPVGQKGLLDPPFPVIGNLPGSLNRENESKRWSGDRDLKQSLNAPSRDDRPPYHQDKNQLAREVQGPRDVGAPKDKIGTGPEFQSSGGEQRKDQDYRDIDYRTGSGRVFDYKHEELPATANVLKESKESSPSKFSGSQDQDYRSATVKDKVSHTISIIGIPKTATMEQILGAFAVRDGVPMQGMKIKSVVPGYSYDTAYVEFLNLEDAVHFMESNKGSLKVGTKIASMKYIQPGKSEKDAPELGGKGPLAQEPLLPSPVGKPQEKPKSSQNGSQPKPMEPPGQRQRSSDLTPEAWQQQVDQRLRLQETEQQAEAWANRNAPRHGAPHSDPIFKESKTMIIKNVKPTTTVDTILKALDPFAYLDERNVRLVKGKPPGAKCFCFVDMDSHEQVTRLVELLTKPRPLSIDGVRVYAEVAKPLKNQNFRKEFDKSNSSLLGYPTEAHMLEQQQYYHGLQLPMDSSSSAAMQGDPTTGSVSGSMNPASMSGAHMDPSYSQGMGYGEAPPMDPSFQARGPHGSDGAPGMAASGEPLEAYIYGSETPDMSSYLFDATSGFYYDPQTTLYYDPGSRYFYNAQTQGYLYWDSVTKSYIPVPGGGSAESPAAVAMAPDMQAILSNPAADAPLELKKPSDPKAPDPPPPALVTSGAGVAAPLVPSPGPAAPHSPTQEAAPFPLSGTDRREDDDAGKKDKEDKPRSLAAFKIMKDMERWAKIQNRQKETVRAPSPVLKIGAPDDRKASKAADAAFAIFKGGDDLFKKPLAPPKNDEKSSKRPMGSLGLLASDYAATGSDEEVEEEKQQQQQTHDPPRVVKSQAEDKEDKLTDWKKMACLLCRRQFPNKDALVRHQQLSDLHKQNMEIHLKIKRSKKELEALENQEKELGLKEPAPSPEPKRRKHQHHHHHQQQQQQHHSSWAGGSRDSHKMSERPGLGSEPVERKKKEPVWDHATYKQAVRKAMFARFKELD